MIKWLLLFSCVFFSTTSIASVDIERACDEKKEQKSSLLTKMSTSLSEAHLAGQCTGYWSFDEVPLKKACIEFVEQKNSLLPFLSTSLSEANLAGICVGAIYRVAQRCKASTSNIDFLGIAEDAHSVISIQNQFYCYGEDYR